MSEEVVEQEQEQPEYTEIEQKAIEQGWNPDYDGPNAKSAEEFIEFGEKRTPVLKERNDALIAEVRQLKQMQQDFQKQHFESLKKAREDERRRVIEELEAKRDQAAEEGDMETYRQTQNKIKVETAKPLDDVLEIPQQHQIDPEFYAWQAENTWYQTDKIMTAAANTIGEDLINENPNMRGEKFYREVEKRVKQEFPHKFGGSPAHPQATEKRQPVQKRSGGKKWDDLPSEIKRDAEGIIGKGQMFESKDAYAKKYFELYGEA